MSDAEKPTVSCWRRALAVFAVCSSGACTVHRHAPKDGLGGVRQAVRGWPPARYVTHRAAIPCRRKSRLFAEPRDWWR